MSYVNQFRARAICFWEDPDPESNPTKIEMSYSDFDELCNAFAAMEVEVYSLNESFLKFINEKS